MPIEHQQQYFHRSLADALQQVTNLDEPVPNLDDAMHSLTPFHEGIGQVTNVSFAQGSWSTYA